MVIVKNRGAQAGKAVNLFRIRVANDRSQKLTCFSG
jgi:hypothetical protein